MIISKSNNRNEPAFLHMFLYASKMILCEYGMNCIMGSSVISQLPIWAKKNGVMQPQWLQSVHNILASFEEHLKALFQANLP